MKDGRGTKLAAAFVVTVAATACKKTTLEPESVSVGHSNGKCTMNVPTHCPMGASCNPPPPPEIDCPAEYREAGAPDPSPERPEGKSGWLRVKPRLWVGHSRCGYNAPYFCAPPGKPYACTKSPEALSSTTVTCGPPKDEPADARTFERVHLESFVAYDGIGKCSTIPAFDCAPGDCSDQMPAGTPTPCPQ